jgi:hypothetical protein
VGQGAGLGVGLKIEVKKISEVRELGRNGILGAERGRNRLNLEKQTSFSRFSSDFFFPAPILA